MPTDAHAFLTELHALCRRSGYLLLPYLGSGEPRVAEALPEEIEAYFEAAFAALESDAPPKPVWSELAKG